MLNKGSLRITAPFSHSFSWIPPKLSMPLASQRQLLCSQTSPPQSTIRGPFLILPHFPFSSLSSLSSKGSPKSSAKISEPLGLCQPHRLLTETESLILDLIPSLLILLPCLLIVPATARLVHHLCTFCEFTLWLPAIAIALI